MCKVVWQEWLGGALALGKNAATYTAYPSSIDISFGVSSSKRTPRQSASSTVRGDKCQATKRNDCRVARRGDPKPGTVSRLLHGRKTDRRRVSKVVTTSGRVAELRGHRLARGTTVRDTTSAAERASKRARQPATLNAEKGASCFIPQTARCIARTVVSTRVRRGRDWFRPFVKVQVDGAKPNVLHRNTGKITQRTEA